MQVEFIDGKDRVHRLIVLTQLSLAQLLHSIHKNGYRYKILD